MNEISGSHVVELGEGLLDVDDLVETNVGVEIGLNGVEGHDGPVSTVTTVACVRPTVL